MVKYLFVIHPKSSYSQDRGKGGSVTEAEEIFVSWVQT